MRAKYIVVLSSLLFAPAFGAVAADSHPVPVVSSDQAGPLTLTEAKQLVTSSLQASGQSTMHAGRAEFAGNGNVMVEVVTLQGLPVSHVLVDGTTRQLAAAKGRAAPKG